MANIALVVGALVILAVVIFFVARLMSVIDKNSIKGGENYAEEKQALVAERLQKVGSVKTASAAPADAAPKAARSGEQVVKAVCASCHAAGVLGAPKLKEGADWAPRLAQGLPALVSNAVNGINSMPPKGGDATLSEDEVRAAVVYILKEAGHDVADAAPAAAEEAPAPKAEAKPEAAVASAKEAAVEVAEEAVDVANDAVETAASTVSEMTESVTEKATAVAGTAVAATTAPVVSARDKLKAAKAAAAKAAAAETAAAETAEPVAAEAPAEPVAAAAPAAANFEKGKALYKQACAACHDSGLAKAPIVGKADQWTARLATGKDALYQSAIAGKGAMPPKGGRIDASDELIRETVDYMVSMSGG